MDTTKLKNDKYLLGRFNKPNDFKGWFVGSFFDENHPCKTDKVEILYRENEKGHICKAHYHQQKVEIIIMLAGKAEYNINNKSVILNSGNFLFVDVNNIISGEFLQDSKIFAIHAPSIPSDKTVIE